MKPVNRIALIGVLTALNAASRELLRFLPNIKPVTSIIILSTLVFGLAFGVELSITTVLISSVFTGLGPWVLFQMLAWVLIALFTHILDKTLPFGKIVVFTAWSFLCGYIYGFFVSLDKLAIGMSYFIAYYLRGLTFDTFHAAGNLIFFPLCYKALMPVFKKYIVKSRFYS